MRSERLHTRQPCESEPERSRPDDAALVLPVANHVGVAGLGQSEDVRRELLQVSAPVQPHLKEAHSQTDYPEKDNAQLKEAQRR